MAEIENDQVPAKLDDVLGDKAPSDAKGTSGPSSSSGPSNLSADVLGRDEIQKQFRAFENAFRLRREARGLIPRLHQQQISKLSAISEKKRWDLSLETETMRKKTGARSIEQIEALHEQAERYGALVKNETLRNEQIERDIRDVETRIVSLKMSTGGVGSELKRSHQLERKIKNHENLLDKALVKFNEASNSNQQLKDVIDFLRRERLVFDSVQDKMLREIRDKRAATSDMLVRSEAFGKDADGFQQQMRHIKDAVDQEFRALERGWHEIAASLADQEEVMDELDKSHQNDLQKRAELHAKHGERERDLAGRLRAAEAAITDKREAIRAARARIEQTERQFEDVRRATSIESIDALVDGFLKAEEDNFHLYKQIGALQEGIETVDDEIVAAQAELQKYRNRQAGRPNESNTERMTRSLAKKVAAIVKEYEESSKDAQEATATLVSICRHVADISHEIGTGERRSATAYGEMNDTTVAEELATIEEVVVDLLNKFVAQKGENGVGDVRLLMRQIRVQDVAIVPPTVEEDDLDDDAAGAAHEGAAAPHAPRRDNK
ncbi:unnamed protein product (mitochondrion) [Plasmodiophora brassicae]|uniref:ODAD1 central coiled coil region domain-containing protein n=1 Tax=Plasmodiophora brassicae TaxID=37360 RepID=A0A0G4J7G6_PLABS|nr:hypothetical protein PBRA_009415 [Plasmodiophora brassicae]SPR00928.1 unnamed protein product [Plasmodiophora brassicae]